MKHADDFIIPQPEQLDEHRKLWIDTMNHIRHDWLNDLQLIMGYMQMRKYDKLTACVDMLKQRLTEESRVSKLGEPGLIELLFTYRTRPLPYRFELELDELVDVTACQPSGSEVELAARTALALIECSAKIGERGAENVLRCSFRRGSEDVLMQFDYAGAYSAPELSLGVKNMEERLLHQGIRSGIETKFAEGTARLAFRFPLRA